MPRLKRKRTIPTDRRPRVSVVVPCYNYGRFLTECVESVLSQQLVKAEVLIIDDASTDGSAVIAQRLANSDTRVSAICHEFNRGHIATYNEGLDLVDGDYSVLLSADDLLPVGALARAVALLEADTSLGLVYGHPVNFSGSEPPHARTSAHTWSVWRGESWIRAQCRRGLNCIYSPEVVMRTSVRKFIGGYNDTLPHTADLEMWLRTAAVAKIGRVNGADQAYRRLHGAGMMQTSYSYALTDLLERKKAYEGFFASSGSQVRNARSSLEIVRRRLAAEAIEHACEILESEDQDSPPSANEYIKFARETYSDPTGLRAWAEYQLLADSSYLRAKSLRRRGYAAVRHTEARLRFRRWQLAGI